jgi:RNA-splicing ligase RtcB
MKTRNLVAIGIPAGPCAERAKQLLQQAQTAKRSTSAVLEDLKRVAAAPSAVQQMTNACKLPVAVAGALMPDAHVGYGLPIGGVLATDNAVIPYAVGVDIACRMKLTVLDLPVGALADEQDRLARAIERETRFGIGAAFRSRAAARRHGPDWNVTPVTARMKDRRGRSSARAAAATTSSSSAS